MPQYQPRIAVVGAGPAGLTLGVLLHKRGVPFTIFEARHRPTDEELAQPSGMLDLHQESGLAALGAGGLLEEFQPLTAECAQSAIIADKDGSTVYSDDGDLEYRPEISRHALTRLLLAHVPAECIRWDCKLVSSSVRPGQGVVLDFGSQGAAEFDFVVGADGAWSRVRPAITDVRPHYSGLSYVTLTITDVTRKYPHLSGLLGRGTFFALGNNNGVVSHRGARDSARLYLSVRCGEDAAGLAGMSAERVKERLLGDVQLFAGWGPRMRELVAAACGEEAANGSPSLAVKPLCMLPVGHSWDAVPGLTLIGDAAHLMLPFAGEGVNLAMWDALDLSGVIAGAVESAPPPADGAGFREAIGEPLREFESAMFARAKERAEETWRNCGVMFSDDGANAMAELMRSFGPTPE